MISHSGYWKEVEGQRWRRFLSIDLRIIGWIILYPVSLSASVISAMEILSYRDIPCDIAVHTMLLTS